ncbi:MAG: MBL fold metallo-hydrolase [Gammaproteobacteria bacterium]|nr:MBL fold metallo-hydrolase [Gammaproteobacteria bacterium]
MTNFRLAFGAGLALLSGLALAGSPVPDVAPVRVSEHVYVLHGSKERPNPQNLGFMNNPAIVLTETGAVIVDPGGTAEVGHMVLRQLRKLTDKPVTDILVTHIHGDHWLASSVIREAYPGVRMYAHPHMIEEAKAGEGQRWVELMLRFTDGASESTRVEIPQSPLSDGQELQIGGLTFRVYLSDIAHTRSDAMFEVVQDQLIFLGDLGVFERMGRMEPEISSFRGNIAGLERALALKLKYYVPGHGPSGGSDRASAFRDYLKIIYDAAARGMEEGKAPFEIKQQLAPRVEAFRSWTGFNDNFGQQVSLAVLEAEQAAF